jgi:hypothetical protein
MPRSPKQDLAAEHVSLGAVNAKGLRPFIMLVNTGASVDRLWGRMAVDLAGVEYAPKIPILVDHDPAQRLGYADHATVTAEGLELRGYLLSTGDAQRIAQESDDGFPFQASVSLSVSEWTEIEAGATGKANGREYPGPVSIARKSYLRESSYLPAGADRHTYAIALAEETIMTLEEFLAAHPEHAAQIRDAHSAELSAARGAVRDEATEYLAAFPGREAFGFARFAAGDTLLEARAALAGVLETELAAAKAARVPDEVSVEVLVAQARPGVGFDGASCASPTAETLWADEAIRREFGGSRSAFLHAVRRGLLEEIPQ